jgi:hypothetical protein
MRAVHAAERSWIPSNGTGSGTGVQLSEWERDDWTYHAKGKLKNLKNAIRSPISYFFINI